MALGHPEKICRATKSRGYRRAVKMFTRKKRRQMERKDPENAPLKVPAHGWTE